MHSHLRIRGGLLATAAVLILLSTPECSDETGLGDSGGRADATLGELGGADRGAGPACDPDRATPPWPAWVPAWPGRGRNASNRTTFRVLGQGATISDVKVQELAATSAVLSWSTDGDADSTVAWGKSPERCPTGYHRSGARRAHRMLLAPLSPATGYHYVIRSSDGQQSATRGGSFRTPALAAATRLDACASISKAGSYRLTRDLTADCTCFEITAAGVTLDLGWHTVTYADRSTTAQCHGVSVRANNVSVGRGVVLQGRAGGSLYSHALSGRGATGITFHQIWLWVQRADAFGLRTMYARDVTVKDLLVVSGVRDVTDRHYPGNRGIALDLPDDSARGQVLDCVLFGVPHWGIYMTGGTRLSARPTTRPFRVVAGNHVFARMHATNGYAIGAHANHMDVHHNEIRPLDNGRAIHYTASNGWIHHNIVEAVELIAGDEKQGYAYYSDLKDPNSPHDRSVCSWVVAHGVRVESGNYGRVYNNEVYTTSRPGVSFGSTALNISTAAGARGGMEVDHNQFSARRAPGSISCNGGPVVTRAGWVRGAAPAEPARLHHNRFVSNGETLKIESAALATSTSDTEVKE
jgi:hypothetical protein